MFRGMYTEGLSQERLKQLLTGSVAKEEYKELDQSLLQKQSLAPFLLAVEKAAQEATQARLEKEKEEKQARQKAARETEEKQKAFVRIGSLDVDLRSLFADKKTALEQLKNYATQAYFQGTDDAKCILFLQKIMRQIIEKEEEKGNTASPLPSLLDEIYFDLLQKINAENHSDDYALYLRYCESSLKYYSSKKIPLEQKDLASLANQILGATALSKQKATREEFSVYMEILWRSKQAIEKINSPNNSNDENTQKIGALAIKAMNHKTRWGMLIGSLAFAMVGVLLIIASKMLLNATLGASAPVSMIGYTVGKGMISENIPVIGFCIGGLMTAVGLGLATATYGSTPVPVPTLVSTAACAFHKELARKNDAAKAKPPVQDRRNSFVPG